MMKDQKRTPLFDRILDYINEETTPFHVPAHKMGKGIPSKWKDFTGENIFKMDLTEVQGLDDLHQAEGVIQEAQKLAAEAWGADSSYFLVNGTSGGIVASICTVAKQGEKIIVPRNSHKSTVYGLIVSGAVPVYISPEIDQEKGLVGGILPSTLQKAYRDNKEAKGMIAVSPTYYGICSDIKRLIEITHQYNGIFIADEAHGNHVYFHEKLPKGALYLGADLCCQSIHKMSGSLGQSSILHTKGNRVDVNRLKANLQMMQSTSPSYILMVSLDLARSNMATEGHKLLGNLIELTEKARKQIEKIPFIEVLGPSITGIHGVAEYEPARLVISARKLGMQGYELYKLLRKDYKIEIEFGDYFYGVCILGIYTTQDELDRLVRALEDISTRYRGQKEQLVWNEELPPIPPQIITPREAYFADVEKVPWSRAKGRIIADMVVPYPPGIPAICPGELITDEVWDFLDAQRKAERHFHGPEDGSLTYIQVVSKLG